MKKNKKKGFTLIELLVVVAIISILTLISVSSYRSAQIKGRDTERKFNLDSVLKSLMLYYNDTGKFPETFEFGNIKVGFTGVSKIVYMRETPLDPANKGDYIYVYKTSADLKKFALFANLENKKDSQCKSEDGDDYIVDSIHYCYAISSPNTTPKDFLDNYY